MAYCHSMIHLFRKFAKGNTFDNMCSENLTTWPTKSDNSQTSSIALIGKTLYVMPGRK